MKFLLSGLFISLAVSLSAAKPACYWDFDNINPKTRAPLSNNGIHYYNALIIENGGVNGTNGLLCNGKRRNQIVLPLDCKEWTAELKFKLIARIPRIPDISLHMSMLHGTLPAFFSILTETED